VEYGDILHKWAGLYALSRLNFGQLDLDAGVQDAIRDVLLQEIAGDVTSIRLMAASILTIKGSKDGIPVLIDLLQEDGILMNSEPIILICQHAYDTLEGYLPLIFGERCTAGLIDTDGYNDMLSWWDSYGDTLVWNPVIKRFELP
jgi:hypothetical protein